MAYEVLIPAIEWASVSEVPHMIVSPEELVLPMCRAAIGTSNVTRIICTERTVTAAGCHHHYLAEPDCWLLPAHCLLRLSLAVMWLTRQIIKVTTATMLGLATCTTQYKHGPLLWVLPDPNAHHYGCLYLINKLHNSSLKLPVLNN